MSVNQNNISSLKEDILFWIIGLENNYFKCYLSLEKNGNNNHSLIFQFLFRKLIIFLSISFNPSKKNFLYQKLSNLNTTITQGLHPLPWNSTIQTSLHYLPQQNIKLKKRKCISLPQSPHFHTHPVDSASILHKSPTTTCLLQCYLPLIRILKLLVYRQAHQKCKRSIKIHES